MEKIKALMPYKFLGRTGLKVSLLSYGNWLNSNNPEDYQNTKTCIDLCLQAGVNFFDTAQIYGTKNGDAQEKMGKAFKQLGVNRKDIVVSTKLISAGTGPNDSGLSRKHIIQGLKNSLARLQLDYVDVVFCHRPDILTPLQETCRAMSWVIDQGWAFYWGTSEWTASRISQAIGICEKYNLHKPVVQQCCYSLLKRDRFEKQYASLFQQFGYGTTIWSSLAGGLLTGKYNSGQIPKDSRYSKFQFLKRYYSEYFGEKETVEESNQKLLKMAALAKEFGCSQTQLAICWVLANKDVSTCLLGFSRGQQVKENLQSLTFMQKWNKQIESKLQQIFKNAPVQDIDFRGWKPYQNRRQI